MPNRLCLLENEYQAKLLGLAAHRVQDLLRSDQQCARAEVHVATLLHERMYVFMNSPLSHAAAPMQSTPQNQMGMPTKSCGNLGLRHMLHVQALPFTSCAFPQTRTIHACSVIEQSSDSLDSWSAVSRTTHACSLIEQSSDSLDSWSAVSSGLLATVWPPTEEIITADDALSSTQDCVQEEEGIESELQSRCDANPRKRKVIFQAQEAGSKSKRKLESVHISR
jgi:hypothetical protein